MKKIIVSACLLGTPCRYDGKSKPCGEVIALQERFTLVPICPEVMGGLSTPRTPAERQGNKVVTGDGKDVTNAYRKGAELVLEKAKEAGCSFAILKEKSPACGNGKIYDGTFSKTLTEGYGVCAEHLLQNGIRVIGESEIEKLKEEK